MEEKRREAAPHPAASSVGSGPEAPTVEPASSRRRAGGNKRKASAPNSSNSQSTPSKRLTRDKAFVSHNLIHNGPLTRARQGPSNLGSASESNSAYGVKLEGQAAVKMLPKAEEAVIDELNNACEEWEALEAKIEAQFDAIRSRDTNAHAVPNHCGWFSWTKIHPLEERTLPIFFNGKSQTRSPNMYMEIRNWLMKKFHANPNTLIELKDLSDLEVGDLDARQEVMDFLDYWGLINFHPFLPTDTAPANDDSDRASENESLLEELYLFEKIKSCQPVVSKPKMTTPVPSRPFPESAIAEELVRPEGPSVEYHCNSCSADCSRKRYHCQKQADFDLCTDCFNNRKFGSGMFSSDFILMEPAEAPGLSGGKWTDQETLLLLEALELYKENWNEIAEHVATKTKAQCILHFVQMPIEDTFLDCDDETDPSSKEVADPTGANNDASGPKDAPETIKSKTDANDAQPQPSPMETLKPEDTSEAIVNQETSKPEDASGVKVGEEISPSEDIIELKAGQGTGEDIALKAIREAFEAVGYLPTPEGPFSFAEMGNPVMALTMFLTRLVGPDVATASARSSLKSISGNAHAMQLAARHCFLLEDPPDTMKEAISSESVVAEEADRDAQKEKQEDESLEEDNSTPVVVDVDTSNVHGDNNIEISTPPENKPSVSPNSEAIEKLHATKEPSDAGAYEEKEHDNLNESSNPELSKDQELDNLACTISPSSVKESVERTSVGEPSQPTDSVKDISMISDSVTSEKNEPSQPLASESVQEPSEPAEPKASEDVEMVCEFLPPVKSEGQQPIASTLKEEPSQPIETSQDMHMASDSVPSEMDEPQQAVMSNSMVENGITTDQDDIKDSERDNSDCKETKDDHTIDKIKRAAVTAISAAAVKAKLLANQEEDQIRLLATSLIEKQLHKLETKLACFNEMESVVMRMREQLDRSRQRLYHERAQIIATRLGLPASASRAMPPSLPANRIATNFANSIQRPPMSMTSQRPPFLRPVGTMVPTSSNPLVPTTAAGSSIRPSSQDKLSSVGTK
ncbi:Myb_DNA-binding domain-containing protein/ZZ domain-containing protein/SWIRM domain-containing protein [Cephalotus follicularis]|uniref:Myb_DNA-binding domain-containing protein/ZZ domain-containing protein/SWIRM domain-containing protein n=1 Tax=Cephalotus follicularis TaxID=3775 RepID=A0A1Q3C0E9_CEPFO|nr:Myb_DNA-binding domain-containing protein/ZZ domain-containing protein/SWIRM domain-containing protein [Cephalotus follicularis]